MRARRKRPIACRQVARMHLYLNLISRFDACVCACACLCERVQADA